MTVVGPVSLSKSTITVLPSTIASGGTTMVTLTARDANGNQEPGGGLTVKFVLGTGSARGTFSAVTDKGNGIYTTTFTGIVVGSDTVTATINGQPVTSKRPTVTVVPGPVSIWQSTVTVSKSQIALRGKTTVTLTAQDVFGNQELGGGLVVEFALGTGSAGGTWCAVKDNKNGTYTATFTATATGSDTITANIDGQAIPSTVMVTVVAADTAAVPSLGTASASGVATDAALRAWLLDESAATDLADDWVPGGSTSVGSGWMMRSPRF
jgi:adhesin/invasin